MSYKLCCICNSVQHDSYFATCNNSECIDKVFKELEQWNKKHGERIAYRSVDKITEKNNILQLKEKDDIRRRQKLIKQIINFI